MKTNFTSLLSLLFSLIIFSCCNNDITNCIYKSEKGDHYIQFFNNGKVKIALHDDYFGLANFQKNDNEIIIYHYRHYEDKENLFICHLEGNILRLSNNRNEFRQIFNKQPKPQTGKSKYADKIYECATERLQINFISDNIVTKCPIKERWNEYSKIDIGKYRIVKDGTIIAEWKDQVIEFIPENNNLTATDGIGNYVFRETNSESALDYNYVRPSIYSHFIE